MVDSEFKKTQDVVKNELAELYLRMFNQFHKLCILELPGEMSALSAAYSIDKEEVFTEVVQNRLNAIQLPRRDNGN